MRKITKKTNCDICPENTGCIFCKYEQEHRCAWFIMPKKEFEEELNDIENMRSKYRKE